MTIATPWGQSQHSEKYGQGVIFYSTASHGGFQLNATRNSRVHESWRNNNGWYEEDSEWAIVAFTFPELFTMENLESARKTLISYYPDQYELITGEKILPGESYARDKLTFGVKHQNDWVVISALNVDNPPNMVQCYATRGGIRGDNIEETKFYVPRDEYAKRSLFGFVIDLDRHHEIIDEKSMCQNG